MNNDVKKMILDNSKRKTADERELESFVQEARKNSYLVLRLIISEVIDKFIHCGAIINENDQDIEKTSLSVDLIYCPGLYGASEMPRYAIDEYRKRKALADRYNKNNNPSEIRFFEYKDKYENRVLPILTDVFNEYEGTFITSQKNLNRKVGIRSAGSFLYDGVTLTFSLELIRTLVRKALYGELKDQLFDNKLLDKLKSVPEEISKEKKAFKKFMESINGNEDVIYKEIYRRLIEVHREGKWGEADEVSIPIKYSSDTEKYSSYLSRDAFMLCEYLKDDGTMDYLPVQESLLMSKLKDDYQIGFTSYKRDILCIKLGFYAQLFNEFLNGLNNQK